MSANAAVRTKAPQQFLPPGGDGAKLLTMAVKATWFLSPVIS